MFLDTIEVIHTILFARAEICLEIVNFQYLQLGVFCYNFVAKLWPEGLIAFQWHSAQLRKRKLSRKQISPFVLEVVCLEIESIQYTTQVNSAFYLA